MRRCRRCRHPLAYRGRVWGCMNRFCTYERPAKPDELARLIADVTAARRDRPAPERSR